MTSRTIEYPILIAILVTVVSATLANPNPNGGGNNEIEARRRSILDNNFMRFGRNNYNPHAVLLKAARLEEESKQLARDLTKRNNDFLRFGRNDRLFSLLQKGNDDVDQQLELAEEPPMAMMIDRPQVRASNSFMRLGRNMPAPPPQLQWTLLQQQPDDFVEAEV